MRDDTILPVGTVTFLFSDIEGSTRLLRDLGPGYQDLLMRTEEVLGDCWARHHGTVVNTAGDSFFVVFESADDALVAAISGQRALVSADWPSGVVPRVRIGLHTGVASLGGRDYVALAVHQAARVADAAHGGQVLLTSATRAALVGGLPLPLEDLGRFTIRDFDEPQQLFRVQPDGWPGTSRPPRLRPADGHNLPRPLTSLVGREEDLGWLRREVRPGRLVSLVGPGGVGKTRLAVDFGLSVAREWEDGVWFVDLVPTRTAAEVANALADAVGARSQPGRPALEDAITHLAERSALVILDNCEHVQDLAREVTTGLLRACPGVGVLATSQASLGMHGQPTRQLAPLAITGADPPAVRLFEQRAGEVSSEDRDDVRSLCAYVDGVPLAIELVAAHSAKLRPGALLELLRDDGLRLTSEDPALPSRHRSLTGVLEWSRSDLRPDAEAVLRRLSLFPGPFGLRDAVAACSVDDVTSDAVPELLLSLVDQSLVLPEQAGGGSRFRLLAPVRGFARELCSPDEIGRSAVSLAAVYLDRMGPQRATSAGWASELGENLDNVRGVVRELAGRDEPLGQQLAWSIAELHALKGSVATGSAEAVEHLGLLADAGPARVALLGRAAALLITAGELVEAEALLDEADRVCGSAGAPPWDEAGHLRARGDLLLRRGALRRARALAGEILESAGTPRGRARGWNLLGIAFAIEGAMQNAVEAFLEELDACRQGRLELYVTVAEGNVAEAFYRLGRWPEAARHQRMVLRVSRLLGRTAVAVHSIVLAARMLGPRDDALAVTLEYAATEAYRVEGYAQYDADEEVRREHLRQRSRRLGAQAFLEAAQAGRAMDLERALSTAETLLERIEWEGGEP